MEAKTPQERDTLDLLELTLQLYARAISSIKMNDAYVEAREELELRITNQQLEKVKDEVKDVVKVSRAKHILFEGDVYKHCDRENVKGIDFIEWNDSAAGAKFELYPIKDIHTVQQVGEAKKVLKRDRDVVKIYTTWITVKQL